MMSQILQQPFFQVTLPIMLTLVATVWVAQWAQNKRLDDIVRRLDAIDSRLAGVEGKLSTLAERVTRLEERTSLFGRAR